MSRQARARAAPRPEPWLTCVTAEWADSSCAPRRCAAIIVQLSSGRSTARSDDARVFYLFGNMLGHRCLSQSEFGRPLLAASSLTNLSGTRLACANDRSRPVTSAQPPDAPHDPEPAPVPTSPPESPRDRFVRHGRRARLYTWAVLFVALLAVLIVLISRNTASVKLSWAFGSTHASIVWVILAAAVVGWLLGITTAVVFSHRTRRPR